MAGDTVQVDTLSIIPGSFSLSLQTGEAIDSTTFRLFPISARLVWLSKPEADSVVMSYRVFPVLFTEERHHKSRNIILQTPEAVPDPFLIYRPAGAADDLFDFGGLSANGSLVRGISFGNNQSVVVNSSFNLQLAGKLGDVDVLASMTDANLPIQPEGNTRQIQEFDRIFIQFGFNEGKQRLAVGDLQLTRPESYFMSFNKKVQGAQGEARADIGKGWTSTSNGSVAVSKGQYARNTFTGQEGNQGPYRLRGNDGESFIIVLAGTERVYIDGRLLQRGADMDYVIDYNIGEVIFTPNRLITKDSRIVVEFEYSVLYYLRSLVHFGETIASDKWKVRFNAYSEQDARNNPILETFDDSIGVLKKTLLSNIGDDIDRALFPGYDSTAFDSEIRMYKLVDTLGYDSVFVFSTDPDSAHYRVSFSFVGEGKGNYRIKSAALNGRIYEWMEPVDGQPQGSYEPVIQLVTPKRRQMFTIGSEWMPSKGTVISAEVALSNNDVNTFSSIDDADDQGVATRFDIKRITEWKNASGKAFALTTSAGYEFAGRQFIPLDAYRPIEFQRDWSIEDDTILADEHIGSVSVGLNMPKSNRVQYGLSGFVKPRSYEGFTHHLLGSIGAGGFTVRTNTRFTHSDATLHRTLFMRPNVHLSKAFAQLDHFEVGWIYDGEERRTSDAATDTLRHNSHKYDNHLAYIQTPDTSAVYVRVEGSRRMDMLPVEGLFEHATTGNTVNFIGALQKNPASRLGWNLTYRTLEIADTTLTPQEAEEFYLGRLEYNANVRKGLIRSTTLYEVGSGRELRREFTFLSVEPGQGNYIWTDNNGNGLQEIFEFELASDIDLLQADYIRVLTPTNEYINANAVTFNQALHLEPAALWRREKGVRGVIRRFSNSTYAQINRKVLRSAGLRSIDPFTGQIEDSSLVSSITSLRNTFYFNRTAPVFGAEFNVVEHFTKSVLTYGPEERHRTERSVRGRLNIGKRVSSHLQLTTGRQSSFTPAFPIRDYNFTIRKAEPKLSYQEKTSWRVSVLYGYSVKLNAAEFNSERAMTHEVTGEARYARVSKSTLSTRFTYAAIDFTGEAQSALGYAMLSGLKPGNNFVWNLTLERTLAENFQLSISYDGRKSDQSRFVHVGSVQVRTVF